MCAISRSVTSGNRSGASLALPETFMPWKMIARPSSSVMNQGPVALAGGIVLSPQPIPPNATVQATASGAGERSRFMTGIHSTRGDARGLRYTAADREDHEKMTFIHRL